MKSLKKFLAAALAAVTCCSIAVFAACDGDSSVSSGGGNTADDAVEREIQSGMLATIGDVYTSADGYEITLTANGSTAYTDDGTAYESTVSGTADIKTKSVDGELHADVILESSSVDKTTESSETYTNTYNTYTNVLLRGTDVYEATAYAEDEDLTAAQKEAALYYYTDLSGCLEEYLGEYDADSYAEAYGSGEYDAVISAVVAFLPSLLQDINGTVSTASSGYTLTYDVDGILLNYANTIDSIVTLILGSAQLNTDYTLGEFLADSTVKSIFTKYLEGFTGKDIYNLIDVIAAMNGMSASVLVTLGYIPEGTESQSAYDYIVNFVDNFTIEGDGGASDKLKNLPLNDETIISAATQVKAAVTQIKTRLTAANIDVVFTSNSSYDLTGISVVVKDLTVTMDDIDSTVNFNLSVTIENKAVTLAAVPQNYAVYVMPSDYIESGSYASIYLMNDGTAIIYIEEADGNFITKSGTYTIESGSLTLTGLVIDGNTLTIGFVPGTYVYGYSYTYNGVTYAFDYITSTDEANLCGKLFSEDLTDEGYLFGMTPDYEDYYVYLYTDGTDNYAVLDFYGYVEVGTYAIDGYNLSVTLGGKELEVGFYVYNTGDLNCGYLYTDGDGNEYCFYYASFGETNIAYDLYEDDLMASDNLQCTEGGNPASFEFYRKATFYSIYGLYIHDDDTYALGTFTQDENDNLESITIGETTYNADDGVVIVTFNGKEYSIPADILNLE